MSGNGVGQKNSRANFSEANFILTARVIYHKKKKKYTKSTNKIQNFTLQYFNLQCAKHSCSFRASLSLQEGCWAKDCEELIINLQYCHCYRQERGRQERSGYSLGVLSVSHFSNSRVSHRLQGPRASPSGQDSPLSTGRFWLQPDFLGFHCLCHLCAVSRQGSPAQIELNIKLLHTQSNCLGLMKVEKPRLKNLGAV